MVKFIPFYIRIFFLLLLNQKTFADSIVDETLDYLIKGADNLKLTNKPESILVVGNTGSGKSTFVHYAVVDPSQVESFESDDPDAVDFIVKDYLDKSPSDASTTVSRTIVPELVYDENGNAWYDCPGFSDTRNTSIEIATTYFVKSVVDKAKHLKIVFVVNYASVTTGYDRIDFDTLMSHSVKFIKYVDRYQDSVALMVSKTPPSRIRGSRILDVPEDAAIKSAADFIIGYKNALAEKPGNELKIKLVNALLSKSTDGKYNRIGIFFRPNDVGTFDKIPKLVESRKTIQNIVYNNIHYAENLGDDFGYTLSEKAELDIQVMTQNLHENITDTLKLIDNQIANELKKMGDSFDDLHDRLHYYADGFDQFTKCEKNAKYLTPKKLLLFGREFCSSLNISVDNSFFQNLVKQQKNLNVLTLLSKNAIQLPTEKWLDNLEETKKILTDQSNWYTFIGYLFDFLSTYEAQKYRERYNVKDVNDWGDESGTVKPQGLHIHTNNFEDFIKKQKGYYQLLKNIELTSEHYKALNDIIRLTLQIPTEIECKGSSLVVKGSFVRFSEINLKNCTQADRLYILVSNKFFFDEDKQLNGFNEFVLIANQWFVNRNITIDLSGAEVKNWNPKNVAGTYEKPAGIPGKAGPPGRNGANFFGYAKKIINGESLSINVSGGDGAPGQDGSSAYSESPEFLIPPDKKHDALFGYTSFWNSKYPYRQIDGLKYGDVDYALARLQLCSNGFRSTKYSTSKYTLYARQCCKADGLAGIGGDAGFSGQDKMVLVEKSHRKPNVIGNQGKSGKNGTNVDPCVTKCKHVEYTVSCYDKTGGLSQWIPIPGYEVEYSGYYKFLDEQVDEKCSASARYTTFNDKGAEKSTPNKPLDIAYLINNYKYLLRHQLGKSILYGDLQQIYEAIDLNDEINELYEAKDFVHELNLLEVDYIAYSDEINFTPFYESLLIRLDKFATQSENKTSLEDRKILSALYTAVLTKTNALRKGKNANLIIDIVKYLDIIAENIKTLDDIGKTKVVSEYREQYQAELNAKIDEASKLIQDDINPFIQGKFKEVNDEFKNLIEETHEKFNKTIDQIEQQKKNMIKLKKNVLMRSALSVLDFVGEIAGHAGPEGKLASAVIGAGTGIGRQFIVDPDEIKKIEIPKGVTNIASKLGAVVQKRKKKTIEALKREITELDNALKADKDDIDENEEKKPYKRRQDTTLAELKEKLREAESAENPSQESIESIRTELQKFVDDEKEALGNDAEIKEKKRARLEKYFKRTEIAINLLSTGVDTYNSIRDDWGKVEKLQEAISDNKNQLELLKAFETRVFDELIPSFEELHESIENTRQSLGTKSHVALDVQKWKIKNTIEKTKIDLKDALEGYSSEQVVESCMEKLIEGMGMIIDIYNRIQDYEEQSRLAVYMGQLQTAKYRDIEISDGKLKALYVGLQLNIHSNLIIGQYLTAVSAFKQTVFPYANYYLEIFRLPKNLIQETEGDVEKLVNVIIPQIQTLQARIQELNTTTINDNDLDILSAEFSSKNKAAPPFYVWHNIDFHFEISELLSGKAVYLVADIAEGINLMNAIKFNTINIDFIGINATIQEEIDDILRPAQISMTHLGTSYYRCGHKFYTIESPAQTIVFSRENQGNLPIVRNVVYDKLRNGNNMLSPYALWKLKLEKANFEKLKTYAELVDIELNGRGTYVSPGAQVCATELATNYNLDLSVSEVTQADYYVPEIVFQKSQYLELGLLNNNV